MIEQVTAETLNILLALPGIIATKYTLERQGGQEVLHIFCRHEHVVAVCPYCGQVSDWFQRQRKRCIRYLEIYGKITYVHFPSRRFGCKNCRKPFTESLTWMESR